MPICATIALCCNNKPFGMGATMFGGCLAMIPVVCYTMEAANDFLNVGQQCNEDETECVDDYAFPHNLGYRFFEIFFYNFLLKTLSNRIL